MSEVLQNTGNSFVYNVHEGESLLGQVSRVICIILPRGFVAAGFSERGDLLMIRYKEYDTSLPTWIVDFYEHHFIEEPLLTRPDAVVAVFFGTEKYLISPNEYFDEQIAKRWMQQLYFIEDGEIIASHPIPEDRARYIFAVPGTMKGLANRYFPQANLLPLAVYQFTHRQKSDVTVQCCITPEQVYATLYRNKKLLWHQVFSYLNGEDIAYQIKLACTEFDIQSDEIAVECSLIHIGLNSVLESLSQYFNNIRQTEAGMMSSNKIWMPSISLLQRLYVCAL